MYGNEKCVAQRFQMTEWCLYGIAWQSLPKLWLVQAGAWSGYVTKLGCTLGDDWHDLVALQYCIIHVCPPSFELRNMWCYVIRARGSICFVSNSSLWFFYTPKVHKATPTHTHTPSHCLVPPVQIIYPSMQSSKLPIPESVLMQKLFLRPPPQNQEQQRKWRKLWHFEQYTLALSYQFYDNAWTCIQVSNLNLPITYCSKRDTSIK